jgi:hypothetical protein
MLGGALWIVRERVDKCAGFNVLEDLLGYVLVLVIWKEHS